MKIDIKRIIIISISMCLLLSMPTINLKLTGINSDSSVAYIISLFVLLFPFLLLVLMNSNVVFKDIKMINCGLARETILKLRLKEARVITIITTILTLISFSVQSIFVVNPMLLPFDNIVISVVTTTLLCFVIINYFTYFYLNFNNINQVTVKKSWIAVTLIILLICLPLYFRSFISIIILAVIYGVLSVLKRKSNINSEL